MLSFYDKWVQFAIRWDLVDEVFAAARRGVSALEIAPDWFDWPDGTELPEGPPEARLVAIKHLLETDLAEIREALDPEREPKEALRLSNQGYAILVAFQPCAHAPSTPLYTSLERLLGVGILTGEPRPIYRDAQRPWKRRGGGTHPMGGCGVE